LSNIENKALPCRFNALMAGPVQVVLISCIPMVQLGQRDMSNDLQIYDAVLTDRGSKYAVSGAPARTKTDALAVIKQLTRDKKFAKATHNTWAMISSDHGPIKNDDGESGAGMVIVRMLERENLVDHVIVVTRWFGGTHLGGDRFRRVQDCVRHYLDHRKLD
jgi:hypothetical protein